MPKSTKRPKLLSSTRPGPRPGPRSSLPTCSTTTPSRSTNATSTTTTLSSRLTRSLIRTHHTLQKQLSQALASNDNVKAEELRREMERNGGLVGYQAASRTGQGGIRGGDTSRVLVGWLREEGYLPSSSVGGSSRARSRAKGFAEIGAGAKDEADSEGNKRSEARGQTSTHSTTNIARRSKALRVLEIGALSPYNEITIPTLTIVRRIDLRSTHPLIEERDFMALDPDEEWEGELGYDIVSLSLVVNFVGDARERGEMLRWSVGFLRGRTEREDVNGHTDSAEREGEADDRVDEDDEAQDDGSAYEDREDTMHEDEKADDQPEGVKRDAADTADDPTSHDIRNDDIDEDTSTSTSTTTTTPLLPALFLVLPLPCLTNSRYLTEPHLTAIMASMSYTRTKVKRSSKLFYSLWRFDGPPHPHPRIPPRPAQKGVEEPHSAPPRGVDDEKRTRKREGTSQKVFRKAELRKGRDRNNFCIVLEDKD